MFEKHKQPSLEAGLLIILVVISVFSIGFLSEGKVSGIFGKEEGIVPNSLSEAQTLEKVTGEMVKITGMQMYSNFQAAEKEGNIGKTVTIVDKEYDVTKYQNTYVFFEKGKLQGTDSTGSQQFTRASTAHGPLPATTTPTTNQQLPTPTAQQQATLPQPAEAKHTTVSKENINPEYLQKYKGQSVLGADGYVYNINSDGTIIQKTNEKFDSTTTVYSWEEYKYPYELTAKIPIIVDGKTEYINVEKTVKAKNLDEAKKQLQEEYKDSPRVSILEGHPPAAPTSEVERSTFYQDSINGRNVIVEERGGKIVNYYGAPKEVEADWNKLSPYLDNLEASLNQKEDARQEIIEIKQENAANGIYLTDHQAAQILLKDTSVDQSIKNGIEALGYKPAEPKEGEEKAPEIEGLIEITHNGKPTGTYSYKGKILIKEEEIEAAKKEWKTEKAIKEYKLTDSKYTDKSGLEIYQTRDGKYKTINDDGEAVDYTGLFYKKEKPFGPENQVPVSVYVLETGKKTPTFQYVYIEGIEGLKFDKETLMKITEKGGSVREIYDDTYGTTGVEILKDGEVVRSIITGEYNAIERTGTRIIIDNEHVYLDSEGNKISKKEYEKLGEEGKNPKDVIIELREIEEFGKNNKGERVLKTYYSETMVVKDKNVIIEGIKTNIETGKLEEFTLRVYDENGEKKEITLNKDGSKKEGDDDILSEAQTRFSQFKSRQWFANFEFKLTQFRGLSGWSQLIFSNEDLAKWREGVDKIFSSLYLGTDYWVSAICSKHIPKQQQGTFMMETKDKLFDVVAHVEGERSQPIKGPDGTTQYIYKLTFSIRNPKYSQYDKLKFNVYLHGDRTVQLYTQGIEVEDGKSFTRGAGIRENGELKYDEGHGKPIVQYSSYNYNKICIKFENGILNAEGDIENEVCNVIVEYKGAATKYEKKVVGVTAEGTPITAEKPTEPYQEADF